mgnify:CR=1 FL=1
MKVRAPIGQEGSPPIGQEHHLSVKRVVTLLRLIIPTSCNRALVIRCHEFRPTLVAEYVTPHTPVSTTVIRYSHEPVGHSIVLLPILQLRGATHISLVAHHSQKGMSNILQVSRMSLTRDNMWWCENASTTFTSMFPLFFERWNVCSHKI